MTKAQTWMLSLMVMVALGACGTPGKAAEGTHGEPGKPASSKVALATFAGGCFWCMEPPYDKLPGVLSTTSGYTGGHLANPNYKQVTKGDSGHYESVQIAYDPAQISYARLLEVFWRNVDPFDDGGQFCDRGSSYRTAVFFHDVAQESAALESRADIAARFDETVVTPLIEASVFYPAEDYHQDYYEKNPFRYKLYRRSCGRDNRLQQVWGNEAGG